MKPIQQASAPRVAKEQPAFIARTQSQTPIRLMPKQIVLSDHCSLLTQHFFTPLLSWKDGKVVASKTVTNPIFQFLHTDVSSTGATWNTKPFVWIAPAADFAMVKA